MSSTSLSLNPKVINQQPKVFHRFPELPNELQDMIWNHALTPQLIDFRYADPNIPWHGWAWLLVCGTYHKIVNKNKNDALFSTCQESCAVAMSKYDKYDLINVLAGQDSRELYRPPISFFSRPRYDTWYIPRPSELREFAANMNVVEEKDLGDLKGMEVVRSLALGGLIETLWYDSVDIFYSPGTNPKPNLNRDMRASYFPLWWELSAFMGIEELIVVVPPLDRLKEATRYKFSDWTHLVDYICQYPEHSEARLEWFKVELEQQLLEARDQSNITQSALYSPDFPVARHETFSAWWENPQVTLMSESAFRDRFNLAPPSELQASSRHERNFYGLYDSR